MLAAATGTVEPHVGRARTGHCLRSWHRVLKCTTRPVGGLRVCDEPEIARVSAPYPVEPIRVVGDRPARPVPRLEAPRSQDAVRHFRHDRIVRSGRPTAGEYLV